MEYNRLRLTSTVFKVTYFIHCLPGIMLLHPSHLPYFAVFEQNLRLMNRVKTQYSHIFQSRVAASIANKSTNLTFRTSFDNSYLVPVSAHPSTLHIRPQTTPVSLLLILYYTGEWSSCSGIPSFLDIVFKNLEGSERPKDSIPLLSAKYHTQLTPWQQKHHRKIFYLGKNFSPMHLWLHDWWRKIKHLRENFRTAQYGFFILITLKTPMITLLYRVFRYSEESQQKQIDFTKL